MKNSLLLEIQDSVLKYAKVVSEVIGADVEVVDENLVRIAATGKYQSNFNINIASEGYIYKNVLLTKEKLVIDEPGKHELCQKCNNNNNCIEKMSISSPILQNGKILGVIGILCFDQKHKEKMRKHIDFYIKFIDQICEFISIKAKEHSEEEKKDNFLKLLNQIIDSFEKGVFVIKENKIIHMNLKAIKYFRINNLESKISIIPLEESSFDMQLYDVSLDSKRAKVLGKIIPVFPDMDLYDQIFVFEEIKNSKNINKVAIREPISVEDILGVSNQMNKLRDNIKKVAKFNSTVLITGESGTGKELIARAIHSESDRKNKPFVAINCGAIPENLLESELFGYVKGAFSGADPNGRIGKFELANTGVLFLDEIGDMPLYLQVKILRVLQERKIVKIGSNQMVDLDIRVIAATNQDLKKRIKDSTFREDLYYRLNVIPIEIEPLRERKEDIIFIMEKFLQKYNRFFSKTIKEISDETKEILINYLWPGNIRELENVSEYMVNMSGKNSLLTKDMLPNQIIKYSKPIKKGKLMTLKELEIQHIKEALKIYGNDTKGKKDAAKALGIGIATLYRRLEEM